MDKDKLMYATSTRNDGSMSSIANRHRFLARHHLPYNNCITMQCDHGDIIKVVDQDTLQKVGTREGMITAEALITNSPQLPLLLLTADCIPAIFYDPTNHVIALAHLNRKTIAHHLATSVVHAMNQTFHTSPEELHVWFEPHVKAASYRFELPLAHPPLPALSPYCTYSKDTVSINFARAHFDELVSIGVRPAQIIVSDIDVASSPDYFSHTAGKHDEDKQGRHGTVVMLQN